MQTTLKRVLCHLSISPIRGSVRTYVIGNGRITSNCTKLVANRCNSRLFSMDSQGGDGEDFWNKAWKGSKPSESQSDPGWDSVSSWSTGLTKEHFDGTNEEGKVELPERVSKTMVPRCDGDSELEKAIKESRSFVDNWDRRFKETCALLQQLREPGVRGSYLKDSEKAEMYRLHKSDPETYNVERLAKDYRIMRQRVHAILWLKEMEEEEEKKLGHKLDDSIEVLLDTCPEFFNAHDREFHVASLPYKPDFKVMPEGWDGTTRDPDEVHYEISMKEDEILYQEFLQRLDFNKKKVAGEVKMKRYSRRRPSEGWNFTVEKLGPHGKRGGGGGFKFVSLPDGSSRALNEIEKMYVKRETPRRRRKIFP